MLSLTLSMRISTYLTVDQINIITLVMPVCDSYPLYLVWNLWKAIVVPLRDFLDLALLGYLVWYQTRRNEQIEGVIVRHNSLKKGEALATSEVFYNNIGMGSGGSH